MKSEPFHPLKLPHQRVDADQYREVTLLDSAMTSSHSILTLPACAPSIRFPLLPVMLEFPGIYGIPF